MKKQVTLVLTVLSIGCNSSQLASEGVGSTPTPVSSGAPTPTPTSTGTPDPGAVVAVITGVNASYHLLDDVSFTGLLSHSPNGNITKYLWAITARPAGSTSQLSSTSLPISDFVVDVVGDYTLELTVTDSTNHTGSTSVTFSAAPWEGLRVELQWPNQYTQADMDLHLVNLTQDPTKGVLFNEDGCSNAGSTIATDKGCDCGYETCNAGSIAPGKLDWFVPNVTSDNPTLDNDNIDASVPENINIITPVPGNYEIYVHYYSAEVNSDGSPNSSIPVNTTINVFNGTIPVGSQILQYFDTINQLWDVGTVNISATNVFTFTPKANSATTTTNLTTCTMPAGGSCS